VNNPDETSYHGSKSWRVADMRNRFFFFLIFSLAASSLSAQSGYFPMAVWYGGGKARAPMLEPEPKAKMKIWRADLQQIKALGFNAVRCWIDWATGEPDEARYQFDTLDVILALAQEAGLKVVLQVYMDSAPEWVGRKYPDSLFVSSNGAAIRPESSPGYCRDHPGVQQIDVAFYAALANHVKNHPAFLGWDLWSEPHVINWANPTYIANPEFCFCPHTIARFRRWLEKKYSSLQALNASWYRRYRSWNEVEPNRLSTILSYRDYIDWKYFIMDKLGEDLRDRCEAVKRAAPHTVVTSHAAGVGLFSSPHYWEGQSDDWIMARQVDYYGTSFYPKHSAFVDRDVPWRAALLDFARSFGYSSGRSGFWIGELQGGFGTIALNVSPTVTPEDLRIWTWSALARGAKAICYYAYYPMSTGYESGGFGLIQLDGTVTERSRVAGEIARVVDRNQKLFLDARPAQAQVAVIYNPLAYFVGGRQRAAAYGGPQGEVAGIERDSLLGIHRALFPSNIPLDYVHVDELSPERLKPYHLVFLPYPLMIASRAAAPLREYVRQGGTLVAEARLGWNDELGRSADIIPGFGLHEVMGCREEHVQTGEGGRTEIRWDSNTIPGLNPGDLIPGRWYEETLAPLGSGSKVVARFADGRAAAVTASFGRGKTLTLGSYLSAAYQSRPGETGRRFFSAILQWAGVHAPFAVTGGDVEVRVTDSGPDQILFVFNHGKQTVAPRIRFFGAAAILRGRDLLTDAEVQLSRDDGGFSAAGPIQPGNVRIIHLSSR
jgi:beta-galactosidase GanA